MFKHATNIVPGENLYRSGSAVPDEPCTEASQLFYGEVKNYDYNKPGFAMNTGHFTQVRLLRFMGAAVVVIETQLRTIKIMLENVFPFTISFDLLIMILIIVFSEVLRRKLCERRT